MLIREKAGKQVSKGVWEARRSCHGELLCVVGRARSKGMGFFRQSKGSF